jgi:hypothetical protein
MGIYIAAAITTVAVVVGYGALIARLGRREDWHPLLLAFLVMLPLQPLAFYFVRLPIQAGLTAALGSGVLLAAASTFYAPLTEEPAKWLVLLLPPVRRVLAPNNAVLLALATGLGFGVGEIWFIADQVARSPGIAGLPFYYFGGFFIERAIVCFLHGAFVAFAFMRFAEHRSFLAGGVIGVALHFTVNLPIFLAAIDLFGLGQDIWTLLNLGWIMAFVIGLAVAVGQLWRKGKTPEAHAGRGLAHA